MRKFIKVVVVTGLMLTQFLFSTNLSKMVNTKEEKKVEAAGVALPAIPTVRNEVATGSSADVSTAAQFVAAYTNTAIRNINFTADIALTDANRISVYNHILTRSLKINGNGFKFTSVNDTFNVGASNAAGTTFHLANMVIDKQVNPSVGHLVVGSSTATDIIFENLVSSATSVKWDRIFLSASNTANLFIRGNVDKLPHNEEFAQGIQILVFEANSNFNDPVPPGNNYSTFYSPAVNGKVYIGNNATVYIVGGNAYPIFYLFLEVNTYANANVFLESKLGNIEGVIDGSGVAAGQIYRVDSGAKFKVQNANGEAYSDFNYKAEFYFNPGSIIEMIGSNANDEGGAFYFGNANSRVIMENPKYFDFRNTQIGFPAISVIPAGTQYLQIRDAYIGLWAKGAANLNTNPLLPSPFFDGFGQATKVNLIAGHTAKDATSSTEFNSMPGGYSTYKYNRIATSIKPIFNVTNLTMATTDAPKAIVKELVEPLYVTWNYSGYDASVISVDSNGVVTPLKAGTTNVTVSATGTDNYTSTKTVTVTVTGLPTIIVNPSTISLPLNGTIGDYYAGVSAVDSSGTPLTVTKTGSANATVSGIYPVTYSATDGLNNTVTGKRNYAIGKGVSVGRYVLFAENFTNRVGQVVVSDAGVMSSADVKVFDNVTGLQIPNNTLTFTINKGAYTNAVGTYPMNISTNVSGTALSLGITGTVVAGSAPVIAGEVFTEIALNSTFNNLDGMSANDVEDGNITNTISVTGSVNTALAGVYSIVYRVTDSDNNLVTKSRVVLVNDGNYVAGTSYIIKANDFTRRVGQVNIDGNAMLGAATVAVYDKASGGSFLATPTVVNINRGTYGPTVGVHPVTYTVAFDPTATITIDATVISGDLPIITAPTYTELAVGSTFNEMTGVSANDTEDGLITNKIAHIGSVNTAVAGVYTVVYDVTDSDNNTVTKTSVVVVNDGSYTSGTNFIIKANNFTKRVGEVVTSDTAIKTAAGVVVYNKSNGVVSTEAVTVNKGTYTNAVGAYPISFSVTSDLTTTKAIVGTVVAGSNPVINGATFAEVALNGVFNPNTGVTASDAEDGNISANIVVTGSVNTAVAGVYTLTYSVTDSDNNTTTVTRVVVVNDANYVVGVNYIIKANDFSKRISEVNTSDTAVKTDAGLQVFNKTTGVLTTMSVSVNKGTYTNVKGVYPISFTVDADTAATIGIDATVSEGSIPILTVPSYKEITVGTAFDPMTGVSATDTEDGNITANIVITGSVNNSVAGVYTINYQISDSDGNTITKTQVVVVNDGSLTAGNNFIIKASNFTKRVGEVDTSDAAVKTAAGVVVYSKTTGAVVTEGLTITKGGYTGVEGIYPITFSVTSDPTTTKAVTATVIKGDVPVLNVANFQQVLLNGMFDPTAGISANDTEDGNITANIVITGSVNTAVAGIYTLTYRITDSDNNTVTKTKNVLVNDGTYAVGTNFVIKANNFTKLVSEVDTANAAIISAAGVKVYSKTTGLEVVEAITVNKGGYTNVVGIYPVSFSVTSDPTTNIASTATVSGGNIPTLTSPTFTTINVGEAFNPNTGVSATDVEDGNLTAAVTHTGSVNTAQGGIYTLNYQVSDDDNNTVTAKQIVVVNDGDYAIGDNFIIQVNDFTKLVSQVDTSDDAVIIAAGIEVYSKTTGSLVNESVTLNKGGYTNVVGDYAMSATVTNDTTTVGLFEGRVVTGNIPIITGVNPVEITVGSAFDPMTGVSATDVENGNLTGSVTHTGTVDTATAGIYSLVYSVSDNDGNRTNVTRIIVVNDGNYTVGANYIIKASNFTKRVGEVVVSDAAIKTAAGVVVYNKATGAPTTDAVAIDNGGYDTVAGTYNMTFTLLSEPTLVKPIVATVITGAIPTLTVTAFEEVALNSVYNYNNGVSANDTEDGVITANVTHTGSVDTSVAGIYTINYSVVDSDNNTVTSTRQVLVNDGNYTAGTNFVIKAVDFTKLVSEVNTSDNAVTTAAGVEVRSKVTGLVVTEGLTISKGGYTPTPGLYNITFTVTSDPTATTTAVGTVSGGNAPTLTVPSYTEITVGSTFNPMTGVVAADAESGNLLGSVTQTGSVNTAVAGVYVIDYSVIDSDNNTVTAKQIVVVNDGTISAGTNFIIHANNFTKRVSEVNTSDAAVKTSASIEVYNKVTGVLVNDAVTINKGTYTNVVGIYPMSATVTSDTTTVIAFNGEVVPGDVPTILGATYKEITVGTAFDPNTGVSASDSEDGVISNKITHTGAVDINVAGVYSLVYSVVDSDGNRVNVTRVILVNDGTLTKGTNFIIKASNFTKRIGEVNTSDASIKTDASMAVYDLATGSLTTEAVTVDNGGYTNVVGDYNIIFSVDNEPTLTKQVVGTVTAGNVPVLTLSAFDQIALNETFNPTNGVSATDTEDGNITNNIVVTGSVDTAVAGVYVLTYRIADGDNNTVTKTKTVLVNNGDYVAGANFIIKAVNFTKLVSEVDTADSAIITAANAQVFSKTTGLVVPEAISVNKDTYSTTPGIYNITFRVVSDTTAVTTAVGSVTAGNAPTLTAPTFTEIAVGAAFDETTGLVATDIEDGNITGNVTYTGSVDSAQAGVYVIDYSVSDLDNNTVTTRQVVLVNDGTFVSGANYIVNADEFTRRVGQVVVSDEALIANSFASVIDKATGLVVTKGLTVNQGGYTNVVGVYQPTFTVTDDTLATIQINANVVSGNAPSLNGVETTSIDLNSTFNPMTNVDGSDIEDGNITNNIVVTGSVNTTVAGVYILTYTLTDSDNNIVTKTRSIVVNDGSYVIDGIYAISAHDFTIREDLVDSSDAAVIAAANVKVFNLTDGSEIINPTIVVNSAGYINTVGQYSITFSFNPSITITANVVANLSPELIVPFAQIKLGSTIDPLTGVVAIDAEDGDLIDNVIYGALPDTSKPGIYTLQYAVTDTFGNTTTKTRVILINDGSYTVSGSYIFKADDFSINQSEVIDTSDELVRLSGLEIYSTTSGEKVTTGYMVNDGGYSRAPGKYTITFTIGDGSISIIGLVVEDGIKLPETGSQNGLIYLLLISTLAFSLFKRRA